VEEFERYRVRYVDIVQFETDMSQLYSISLTNNILSGILEMNKLTGTIPTELADLPDLEFLVLCKFIRITMLLVMQQFSL